MRRAIVLASLTLGTPALVAAGFLACSSTPPASFTNPDTGTGGGDSGHDGGLKSGDTGTLPTGDGGHLMGSGDTGTSADVGPDGVTVTTKITIYAHTDTELYSMDPMTMAVTDLGTFTGLSGSYYDSVVTDLAVNAAGQVYVNSEQVVYTAAIPATPGPGAPVKLTQVVNTDPTLPDGGDLPTRFYALAFAPAGALDPTNEVLVGGDSNGNLWAIPTSGAPFEIGNFGTDPSVPANILGLSGDLVFYLTGTGSSAVPTGLATIRSCVPATTKKEAECVETNDYLAAVNMANLKANYAAKSTTASLLGGIYGGTLTADGPGTGHGELFGLGAWNTSVYAFSRCIHCYDGGTSPVPAELLSIDTTSGAATVVTGSNFTFTNGWSGAGVTTKVTITVKVPPATMPPK